MSNLQPKNIVTILGSDLHLSHKSPVARSAETSWYEAQKRTLHLLDELKRKHKCELIIVGDVFNHWDESAELINFAIENLPKCLAIPGNHDTPNHNPEEIHKSAYYTLVEAGIITDMIHGTTIHTEMYDGIAFHPFPFGHTVGDMIKYSVCPDVINVAIIHAYCCTSTTGYKGCESNIVGWKKTLKEFDVAVFGDNHTRFESGKVFNCGSLMRRRFDERSYQPRVGLLRSDGKILSYNLNTKDVFADEIVEFKQMEDLDMDGLVEELQKIQDKGLDFVTALEHFMINHDCSQRVKSLVLKSVEHHSKGNPC